MNRPQHEPGALAAPADPIRAAGGVLWRVDRGGQLQIAVIHRPHRDDWSLPKGKLDPGESEPEAALREVEEETGIRGRLGRGLGTVRYIDARSAPPRPKVVRYWAVEALEGSFQPGPETDELRWVDPEEGRRLLTYERDRDVVARFAAAPPRVAALALVRHADAVDAHSWAGEERFRPLTAAGRERAERLARTLRGFAVHMIVVSSAARCRQTAEPLARAVGLSPIADEGLTEQGYAEDPAGAAARVRRLAVEGSAVVVCTHAPVLADLLRRLGVEAVSAPLSHAGAWVVSLHGGELVDAEYLPGPQL